MTFGVIVGGGGGVLHPHPPPPGGGGVTGGVTDGVTGVFSVRVTVIGAELQLVGFRISQIWYVRMKVPV